MKKFKNIFWLLLLSVACSTEIFSQYPGNPQIDAGVNQTATCANPCVTLSATVMPTGLTNSYTVSSIPYAPPFSYTGDTQVSIDVDDVWSNVIYLPFTFCYYGIPYDRLVVGSNGVITFNISEANGYCPWSYTDPIPSPNLILNAIFGAYHDIDPSVAGNIYYDITGSYPCRAFVFKMNQVAHFSCNSIYTTQQIVLYEGSNVIEVYILNKPVCSTWNSGNAVIGLQNATGTAGITPPGRNTGPWSAANEAWRFTPSDSLNYVVHWFESGIPVDTGLSATVCPAVTTVYTAEVTYSNCSGPPFSLQDTVVVNVDNSAYAGEDDTICALFYIMNAAMEQGTWSFSGGPGAAVMANINSPNTSTLVTTCGEYTFTWTNSCNSSDDVIINFLTQPTAGFTFNNIGNGLAQFIDNSTCATSWHWDFGDGSTDSIQNPVHTYTNYGTYFVTLIVQNPCGSDTSVQTVIITSATISETLNNSVEIFPNPANGIFTIKFEQANNTAFTVKITSVLGEVVFYGNYEKTVSPVLVPVDLKHVAKGIYQISLISGSDIYNARIIIDRY